MLCNNTLLSADCCSDKNLQQKYKRTNMSFGFWTTFTGDNWSALKWAICSVAGLSGLCWFKNTYFIFRYCSCCCRKTNILWSVTQSLLATRKKLNLLDRHRNTYSAQQMCTRKAQEKWRQNVEGWCGRVEALSPGSKTEHSERWGRGLRCCQDYFCNDSFKSVQRLLILIRLQIPSPHPPIFGFFLVYFFPHCDWVNQKEI